MMGLKISLSTARKFINKMIELQPAHIGPLRNDDVFLGQMSRTLTEFISENFKETSRISLSQDQALKRIVGRGMEIRTVVDVGASNGRVAARLRENYFKDANLLCIEGFEVWRDKLEKRKKNMENFDFVIAAAGDSAGLVYFLGNSDHPTQGHAFPTKTDNRYHEVVQTTIDHEVETRRLQGPFMIKIDTHGREGEILIGAEKMLKQTELIMIEVNNFEDRGRMRFHELCSFLEERDFRCADIAEPTWRNKDDTFWQCDMFFIRKNRPEWSVRGY